MLWVLSCVLDNCIGFGEVLCFRDCGIVFWEVFYEGR